MNSVNGIVIPVLYLLSGICVYATITHLSIALRRPLNHVHMLFAGMCLLIALFGLSEAAVYQAQSVAEAMRLQKVSMVEISLFFMLFPWFVAVYTGLRPRVFLVGSSLWFGLLIVVNLTHPYGIQFQDMPQLERIDVPWDERLVRPAGRVSLWFYMGVVAMLTNYAFAYYALIRLYRRVREPASLIMMFAISVFVLASFEGILVRLGVVNFIHLGPFSFLAMVIAMSLALTHETRQRLRVSERRFRYLVEQSPFSIQTFLPDGRTLMVNAAWERLWGLNLAALADYNILEDRQLIDLGVMPQIARGFAGIASEVPPIVYNPADNPIVRGPVRDRWVRTFIYPIMDAQDCVSEVILMHEDITEKKFVEDAIRQIAAGVSTENSELFFRNFVQQIVKLFSADYAFVAMLSATRPGHAETLAVCRQGEIIDNFAYPLAGSPCTGQTGQRTRAYAREVRRQFPEDQLLVELNAEGYICTPLFSRDGETLGFIVVLDSKPLKRLEQFEDILSIFAGRAAAELERMRAETQIRRMAYQDSLTGLGNRTALQARLEQIQRESDDPNAMLLIDLDHFKTINDALGHTVGDEVLCAVARRLSGTANARRYVARLGGDEFGVLLQDLPQDEAEAAAAAEAAAREISRSLTHLVLDGERVFNVGISIGVALFKRGTFTASDILRHADMALYQAKKRGRGNIQFFVPELQAAADERLHLEHGLRNALENRELELYFQPQVTAAGEGFGAEALLRWRHPELGLVAPTTFIPIAEESGLIHPMGKWVLRTTCERLAAWSRAGTPFSGHLSMNLSPWQLTRPDFVQQVLAVTTEAGIDPRRLVLEVTESALMYDLEDTIKKLADLRAAGFRISLDDFGTGYSSLAYLKDLPLDILKIDKTFIDELSAGQKHPTIDAIMTLGRNMGLRVIAEGVESTTQRDLLIASGCTGFQGYFFFHPMPEEAFVNWFNDAAKNRP